MNTDRILLRPLTITDTSNIIKWRNNPLVKKYFIDQNILNEQQHLYWLKNKVETQETVQFIIVDNEQKKDIGTVFLKDIDNIHKKAEFGIFIGDDDARNNGFGQLATKLIIIYGFEHLQLNKIYLRVLSDNERAIHSYEKQGFVREGYFKQEVIIQNEFRDIVFMAVFKNN